MTTKYSPLLLSITLIAMIVFSKSSPAIAQPMIPNPTIAACNVTADNIGEFTREARNVILENNNFEGIAEFFLDAREEDMMQDWKCDANSMYLIILYKLHRDDFVTSAIYHADDRYGIYAHSDWSDLQDKNGNFVIQNLFSVANQSSYTGGAVSFTDNNGQQRTAYAAEIFPKYPNLLVVAGLNINAEPVQIPDEVVAEYPNPEVIASNVVDRKSLKMFVRSAIKFFQAPPEFSPSEIVSQYRFYTFRNVLRDTRSGWRHGSTYIFILREDGSVIFHGADPGQDYRIASHLRDIDGVFFIQELIKIALNGGGFLEYRYDDPSIQGDEEHGSIKLSYAEAVDDPWGSSPGQKVIFGAGFYLGQHFDNLQRVDNLILPEIARAMTSMTIDAISERVEQAAVGDQSDSTFKLGGASTLLDAIVANRESLDAGTYDLPQLLANSSFSLSLDSAVGNSNRFTSGATVWGSGGLVNLAGDTGNAFDWDGQVTSFQVGVDSSITDNVLFGLSISNSHGSVDFSDRTRDERNLPIDGEFEAWLTSVNPYIGYTTSGGVSSWMSIGSGRGEVEIDNGTLSTSSNLNQDFLAAGANGVVYSSDELFENGPFDLKLKFDMFSVKSEVEANETTEGTEQTANRARAIIEGTHTRTLESGDKFIPSFELGTRYDGGDGQTGSGIRTGVGMRYESANSGLSVEGKSWMLVSHSKDSKEWGASGSLHFGPEKNRQGLSMSLNQQWGKSSGGIDQLWSNGVINLSGDDIKTDGRFTATVGYGIATHHSRGLLTPYTSFSLSGGNMHRFSIGSRFEVDAKLNLNLELERKDREKQAPDHGISLNGVLIW